MKQNEHNDIKEKYIKLAQEAYNKYYSKESTSTTTSDEKYLKLAQDAWIESSYGDASKVATKLIESTEDSTTSSKPFFSPPVLIPFLVFHLVSSCHQ